MTRRERKMRLAQRLQVVLAVLLLLGAFLVGANSGVPGLLTYLGGACLTAALFSFEMAIEKYRQGWEGY